MKRLRATSAEALVETHSQQVGKCIKIALECIAETKEDRPSIEYIVNQLDETNINYLERSWVEMVSSLNDHSIHFCFSFLCYNSYHFLCTFSLIRNVFLKKILWDTTT